MKIVNLFHQFLVSSFQFLVVATQNSKHRTQNYANSAEELA